MNSTGEIEDDILFDANIEFYDTVSDSFPSNSHFLHAADKHTQYPIH